MKANLEKPWRMLCCLKHRSVFCGGSLERHIHRGTHRPLQARQQHLDCHWVLALNLRSYCHTLHWCSGSWVISAPYGESMQAFPGKELIPLTGLHACLISIQKNTSGTSGKQAGCTSHSPEARWVQIWEQVQSSVGPSFIFPSNNVASFHS